MGCAFFIAGLVLSAVLGFKAGSVLNGQTISAILGLELIGYFFYAQWSKGRELDNGDIYAIAVSLCLFLFSLVMTFTAVSTMNWDGELTAWLKNLTFR